MDKPLEPGVRKKGRNTYEVSTEYLKEDIQKMGPDNFKEIMKQRKRRAQAFKKGGLSAKQKKIAAKAPPPDKIDAKDFAVLKAEKAKGRGMGLQDEKLKPGKVYKARKGLSFSDKMKLQDAKVIDKTTGKTHLSKNQLDDYLKNQKDPKLQKMGRLEKKYIQQRPGMAPKSLPVAKNILKAAKATRYGKIALGIAGAALGAKELLKSKMKKEDKKMVGGMAKKYSVGGGADMGDPKKPTAVPKGKDSEVMVHNMMPSQTGEKPLAAPQRRRARKDKQPRQEIKSLRQSAGLGYLPKPAMKMGGGMMNKPMGYKSGTMVKARGCKLGRTRPTKMY